MGLTVKAPPAQSGRKREIGLIIPGPVEYARRDPVSRPDRQVAAKALKKVDFALLPWPLASADPLVLADTVAERQWSGAVLLEIDFDPLILELREARVPLVALDYDASRLGVSSVVFDHLHGAFQTTKLLIASGHRRIAFIRPLVENPVVARRGFDWADSVRFEGYRLAMRDAGLDVLYREHQLGSGHAKPALQSLFGVRPAPSACVCVSDTSAQQIAHLLMEMGHRIPEDVSITGFGHSEGSSASEFAPGRGLTSVRVDYTEMGATAARLLLEAIATPAHAVRREMLPAQLVERDSTGPFTLHT